MKKLTTIFLALAVVCLAAVGVGIAHCRAVDDATDWCLSDEARENARIDACVAERMPVFDACGRQCDRHHGPTYETCFNACVRRRTGAPPVDCLIPTAATASPTATPMARP